MAGVKIAGVKSVTLAQDGGAAVAHDVSEVSVSPGGSMVETVLAANGVAGAKETFAAAKFELTLYARGTVSPRDLQRAQAGTVAVSCVGSNGRLHRLTDGWVVGEITENKVEGTIALVVEGRAENYSEVQL